jgi:hypothetical protein
MKKKLFLFQFFLYFSTRNLLAMLSPINEVCEKKSLKAVEEKPQVKLLASNDSTDYEKFIDYLINIDKENDLLSYEHVGNDLRTLLMLLSENFTPSGISTANYKALVYFKNAIDQHNKSNPAKIKEIKVNQVDKHNRTALFYASWYGLENIVNFLIDELNASVHTMDIKAATYENQLNNRKGFPDKETFERIKQKLDNTRQNLARQR